jgi:transposase
VDLLDLKALGIEAEAASEGAPAIHPKVLLAAWLYGFMVRVRSSRQMERACRENIPFLWLTAQHRPDHVTLWRFYNANRATIRQVLKKTVHLAVEVGLVDFALQAVDGSRVAVTSGDSLKDRAGLEQLLAQVESEIASMEQANQGQAGPDGRAPKSQRALLGKQERRARLQKALAIMDKRTEEAAQSPAARRTKRREQTAHKTSAADTGRSGQTRRRLKRRTQTSGPLVSTTDPEARQVKGRHGFCVGYNSQVVVDSKAQIVVAADVVDIASDTNQLVPMLEEAEAMSGRRAKAVAADLGYFAMPDVLTAAERGIEPYVPDLRARRGDGPAKNPYHKEHFVYDGQLDRYTCPLGQPLVYKGDTTWNGKVARAYQGTACPGCPARERGACTKAKRRTLAVFGHEQQLQTHAAKMKTDIAREVMKKRKVTVEPVFGFLREQQGLLRFLVRGREKVKAEWRLLCVAHNLRKLWKLWWRPQVLQVRATI